MRDPRITVCIVTWNQRDLVAQCITSVLEQVVDAEINVLVGDDASDDGTSEVVESLAAAHRGKIQHLIRQPRMGSFGNMRDLIARADGDFIAHVDGDDYWLPGKLQRQLDYLHAHPDCAAVYTNAITVDEAGHRIGLFNDIADARIDLAALLRRGNFLNSSSTMFRIAGKAAWADAVSPQIDYRANLWHARHGWLGQIGEPLVVYRVNTRGSMVANMNDSVRELYWEAIMSVPRILISDDDYACGVADFLRRVAFRAVRMRRWDLVRKWTPRAMAASPYGVVHTGLLTIASILRILLTELADLLQSIVTGRRNRVLYRS
jgi:glycosyltransferase involved in cell wall biosynthesis